MCKQHFSKISLIFIVLLVFTLILSISLTIPSERLRGGDKGWYVVRCDVDWAHVYFDNEYVGDISQGELRVVVHTTQAPYKTYTISKEGCTLFTGNITRFPEKGKTVFLAAKTPSATAATRDIEILSSVGENLQIDVMFLTKEEKVQNFKQSNFTNLFRARRQTVPEDANHSYTPPLSPEILKTIIASEFPEINDETISDWEKVNILREWAYEHTDYTGNMSDPFLTLSAKDSDYYWKTAPELYPMFFDDRGGEVCGGMAHALQQLYEMYGFTSYVEDMGDPNVSNRTSHVVTLVRINYSGSSMLTVQDPYFGVTILDKAQKPLDILDITHMVRVGRFSDLVIQEGLKKPKDMILLKSQVASKKQNKTGWSIIQEDKPVYFGDDRVKVKIDMNLELFNEKKRNSAAINPYINETNPYLGLYKYPIHVLRGQTYVYSLTDALENCASGGDCSQDQIGLSRSIGESAIQNLTPAYEVTINSSSFRENFFPNCYNGDCYHESEEGQLIFRRISIHDHIASLFLAPPLSTTGQRYITQIVYPDKVQMLNGLSIFIQDDEYRFISDNLNDYLFAESEDGNYLVYSTFDLPSSDKSIRITFLSSDYEEHVLPLEIKVYREPEPGSSQGSGELFIRNNTTVNIREDSGEFRVDRDLEGNDDVTLNSIIEQSVINGANNYAQGKDLSKMSSESSKQTYISLIKNITPVYEVTINGRTFMENFYPHCYSGECHRESGTGIIFSGKSEQDHITSPFFTVPNSTQEQNYIAKIIYSDEGQMLNGLDIYLQDDEYKFISDNLNDYVFSETDNGNYVIYSTFSLPPSDRFIRITFLGSDYKEHVLPQKIELYREFVSGEIKGV